jgi:hypothetical protein
MQGDIKCFCGCAIYGEVRRRRAWHSGKVSGDAVGKRGGGGGIKGAQREGEEAAA